jgi:hypothetical protein
MLMIALSLTMQNHKPMEISEQKLITHTISLTTDEATNILNGLNLMYERMHQKQQDVPPFSKDAPKQVLYFKQKQVDIYNQIKTFQKLLK